MIKKSEILELLAGDVASCLFLLEKMKEEDFDNYLKYVDNQFKIYLFLHEFIVDYCEKNNIEEFDF